MIYVTASKIEIKKIFKSLGKEPSIQHYQRAHAVKPRSGRPRLISEVK
ncbi:MAG: hypothetical protein H7A23_05610 [Leptospiraceae bacterium]|nr:hypothetical protein [Leptospiraceae bacterium]MCP5494014.1 hypothetical protein [Leptospiraceae bacterium]